MAMSTENTEANIKKLEDDGYTLSPVSKPYAKNRILRYDVNRKVYWFSCKRHYYPQDTDNSCVGGTLIYLG